MKYSSDIELIHLDTNTQQQKCINGSVEHGRGKALALSHTVIVGGTRRSSDGL